MGGVSRASASRRVPGGTAEAGLDFLALTLADGVVDKLGGEASRLVDALAVALGVQFLEAGALVGAVTAAGGGVVDVVRVGAGSVDADVGGGAELEGSGADAVTTVVVRVRALEGDQGAHAVGGADGVARLEGSTNTTSGSVLATAGGLDALLAGGAVGSASGAEGDARPVVGGGDEVIPADQAVVEGAQNGGGLVDDAVSDQGQASLEVISGVETGVAEGASPVESDVGLAVGDHRPALLSGGRQLVVSGASGADRLDGSVVLGGVGQAELDVGDAAAGVITEVVATVASPAKVLVSYVGEAVVDVLQAQVAVDRQPGHVDVALNAKTQAVVLQAVADASGDARRPVGGLSVGVGALGAQVGPWNVGQAVGDLGQANTVNQHGGVVASEADSGGGSGGVLGTARDHSNDDADGPESEVVALDALSALAIGVNLGARRNSAPNAVAVHQVVESVLIARHAVQVVGVPEDAGGVSGLRMGLQGE